MNFLFPTVLVLLLVAPGLLFFRTYYAGKFSIRYSSLTITDQVFRSIIPGLTVQFILFWAIQAGSDHAAVRLDVLGVLLLGAKDDQTVRQGFALLSQQLGPILLYHLTTMTAGALLGWLTRLLVRWRKWDRRFRWLRYDNQWHYLLTGEILETRDLPLTTGLTDARRIDFVFVDVLMKLEKSNTLYSGILAGYELAADGGLRTLYLTATRRKPLPEPGKETAEIAETGASETAESAGYYRVAGDLMVIAYSQLLNLNLTYYIDEDDARAEGDEPDPDPAASYHVTSVPTDLLPER